MSISNSCPDYLEKRIWNCGKGHTFPFPQKQPFLSSYAAFCETLDVLRSFSRETGLMEEMAEALVKKVTVYGKDCFEIERNFSESVYQFIMEE